MKETRPSEFFQPKLAGLDYFIRGAKVDPAVASVTITGPYAATGSGETLGRRKIFVCRPASNGGGNACAKTILSNLTRRAYRRPVGDREIESLLSRYHTGANRGVFEAGIALTLRSILVSPEFLFRIERDLPKAPPNTAYAINDLELASRLSFFLWSSIPDDELLAIRHRRQAERWCSTGTASPAHVGGSRANSLVSNFAGQWLYLRNLNVVSPDTNQFP